MHVHRSVGKVSCRGHIGFNKKKNFPYLRRFASDHMTAIVVGIFESSADSAGAAAELTGKITAVIESKQALACAHSFRQLHSSSLAPVPMYRVAWRTLVKLDTSRC
eukprot:SAG11_NODE_626_length_8100_cov_5.500875_5_plen_106_part_00